MDNSRNLGNRLWPLYVFAGCFFMGYLGSYYMNSNESKERFDGIEGLVFEDQFIDKPDSSVYDSSYFNIR